MNRRRFLSGAGVALAARSAVAAAESNWRSGAPMPVKRSEFGAALLAGSIVVAGGFDAGGQVEALDLCSGEWRRLTDLPVDVHHPGVAALDGALYVAGGYEVTDQTAVARLHIYDPVRDQWRRGADLPAARGAFGFVAVEGALFALGGALARLNGPATGGVDRYEPAHDRWETIGALPTPREHLAAAAVGGGIYTCGGRANGDESVTFAAAVERFDLASGDWRIEPSLPTPRAGMAAAALGGEIVTAGGERGGLVFRAVEGFTPTTGRWRALPDLTRGRHGLGMAAPGRGRLVALGGSVAGGMVESIADVEIFGPALILRKRWIWSHKVCE